MSIVKTELMPYLKFLQMRRYHVQDNINRKMIEGVFKDMETGTICSGDDFMAYVIGKGTAEEAYKAAIEYWNHLASDGEEIREFVSAKWAEPVKDERECVEK